MTMHGGNKNGPGTEFERAAAAELGDAKVLKRVRQVLIDMHAVSALEGHRHHRSCSERGA